MEIIQDWFDGDCDYTFGVAIYGDLPKHNRQLLSMFQKKENTFNREKLKHELLKFLNTPVPAVAKVVKLKAPQTVTVEDTILAVENKQALFFHQLPPELQPVLLEANQLFKENCFLKVQLNDLPQHAEKKALELQIQISRNFEKNGLCWKKIDYFLEHRIVPQSKQSEHEGLTPAGLLRKQQLLYASISKLNSRLKENNEKLQTAVYVVDKNKVERMIMKQEQNLLKQNEELLIISKLIDG
jgi:hypothetical protein